MTGAEALEQYRAQQKQRQAQAEQGEILNAIPKADHETRRVLAYVGRELLREREPTDHAILRQVLKERLRRIGR